jgi:quercetin dioxygenase-like cupin family protein
VEHVANDGIVWEPAPEEWFTGQVWFGPLAPPATAEALNTLGVMFAPGARTAWHRHVEGQVLYIAHGSGIVANDAGERVEVGSGDAVVIPAGEVHWHGATATSHMMHLSLTTGGPTEWLDRKVSDAEYRG